MDKWRCKVCGYVHTGGEPPAECPICGAGKSEFVKISGEEDPEVSEQVVREEKMVTPDHVAAEESSKATLFTKLTDQMLENHLHPIAVHTPNGIFPAAVLFLSLALLLNMESFELAAFYNTVFVLLAMPVVLFSGYIEWQKHYKGARTTVFMVKIGCGVVVLVTLMILVLWRIYSPEVASPSSSVRWLYFLLHVVAFAAVGLAGHLGGKLVFGNKK